MKIDVELSESSQCFAPKMHELANSFDVEFSNVVVVERVDIPPQYGLITYDNNRTITVT